MEICTASVGSLTLTIKAQKALEGAGIPGRIVKLDPSMTRHGCAYGFEFPCESERFVRQVLGEARIHVSGYFPSGRGDRI